jgi:hypothetical protein
MLVTNQMITQVFLAPEISKKLMTYDRLRWYRSTTGRNGFYEPATAEDPTPALLRGTQVSRALAGKTLRLRVNGTTEVNVTFTGPDPVTLLQVGAAIAAATPDIIASVSEPTLELATALTGSAASIEVLASEAAIALGFLPGEAVLGLSADNALLTGVSQYEFVDHQSSPTHWYTVEFRSSVSSAVSPRSISFASRAAESVPLSKLIGCFVRLCDLSGRPLAGRRVTIHNVFMPNRVEADGRSWGVFRQYEELLTDPNGYAELFIIRGSTIDVTIAGTGFTRRIKVPMTGTIVDLLDPSLDTQDEFGIHKSTIDFAIRTSS